MRVLFAGRSVFHFTYYETVLESLVARGHRVSLRFDERWSRGQSDVALEVWLRARAEIPRRWSRLRDGRLRDPLFGLRELRSYSGYLGRDDQSDFYTQRWRGYLSPSCRRFAATRSGDWLLRRRATPTLLGALDSMVPAVAGIVEDLRDEAPDVVVVSPANMRFAEEIEYLKAARRLRIPTAVLVLSWDNLSTKGLMHVRPDLLLAWNRAHAVEAARYHRVSPGRVLVTGSPFFDKWFDGQLRSQDRAEFLRAVGLPEDRPFVLYLGSSRNIARDESWLVRDLMSALEAPGALHGASVLLRPHPANARPFRDLASNGTSRVAVWPADGQLPENTQMQAHFRDSVRHAVGVVGVNTSAMIDALVLDKPCIALITDRYEATQLRAQHFRHVLASGAINVARNAEECLDQLETLAGGVDEHGAARRAFVEEFVRPYGRTVAAGEFAAAAVTKLGAGAPAAAIAAMSPEQILGP